MNKEQFERLSLLNLLLAVDGIGPTKVLSIFLKFKNVNSILAVSQKELSNTEGIGPALSKVILRSFDKYNLFRLDLDRKLETLAKINAKVITYWDTEFPDLLKRIYYPPVILFYKGNFDELDKFAISIVGTRQPTHYGKNITEKIVEELVQNQITIVSGMARGIDSLAHQTALKFNGRTIAVIGSGLDIIYPQENKKLFNDISEKGLIISEYDLGTKPDAQNFPKRNRIISGLSLGSVIIETKINGGAMQTAAYAIDQNREVFAVPGNINSVYSEGPNSLIQRGEAKLILSVDDILSELKIKLKADTIKKIQQTHIDLNLFEQKLLSVLNDKPLYIDEIAQQASMQIADCLVNLLTLEFKGLITQLPGKVFVKC